MKNSRWLVTQTGGFFSDHVSGQIDLNERILTGVSVKQFLTDCFYGENKNHSAIHFAVKDFYAGVLLKMVWTVCIIYVENLKFKMSSINIPSF